MGLLDISKNDVEKIYLSYRTSNKILELQVIAIKEAPSHFALNISEETSVVKRWAQILQQTPVMYISQLKISLQSKSLKIKEKNNALKEDSSEDIYEFDGKNLTWRQFFREKNMFGRKGVFELKMIETSDSSNLMKIMMTKFVEEFACKDEAIVSLEKQNENLVAENKKLLLIAEKSVKMKEELEKQLYTKFALLLNAKKEKLSKYKKQLMEVGGHCKTSQPTNEQRSQSPSYLDRPQTSSSVQMSSLSKTKTDHLSDEEYEDDTDVDSPIETMSDEENGKDLKRKSSKFISSDESKTKKLSHDLFNDSLEMELESSSIFLGRHLKKT